MEEWDVRRARLAGLSAALRFTQTLSDDYDRSRRPEFGKPARLQQPQCRRVNQPRLLCLRTNPRGSYGHGEAFTRANIEDFGYGDWSDDLAGVSAAIKAAPIDPQRLGLFGWSYGGYMGMWAETQTRRFKAIVAGAGIVNWQSYYGQNNIDEWMIPFFGNSVYEDPNVYAKSSPITFIQHSHTPILILQGERDEEVPAPQAFEFYHAMQTLHVPSRLVLYADEGHGPRKPEN
ncbi:MAG: S9 family peptidase [Candidatus Eremiobacteraeota bacterium]|nr:S9 family peptidase [Candidatus Eremiobacteraeota bacterium]